MSLDPRLPLPETMLAITREGFGLRFALAPHNEVTTKAGRRFAKPQDGDAVIGVVGVRDTDIVAVITHHGYVLYVAVEEINKLEGPGRGITVIKTGEDDHVIGFVAGEKGASMTVENAAGKESALTIGKGADGRGNKGQRPFGTRSTFKVVPPPVTIPSLGTPSGEGN
jgi:DNA gyrase subunit A